MHYSVESVSNTSLQKMLHFLKENENYSLFLLSNFENYGIHLTEAPFSGNFKLILANGKVVGVFCLTRNGNLLIETTWDESIFEMLVMSYQQEPIPLKGVVGNWPFCARFWEYLKENKLIQKEVFASKEILYSVDLQNKDIPPQEGAKLLIEEDYDQWEQLRIDDFRETGIPNDLSNKQRHDLFLEKTRKKIVWGFFLNNTLVSIADLNAKASDLGQVGGVYTAPKFRRSGYSKAVMKQLLHDAKELHSIRKLIIFTGEHNVAAQKLYLSLGVSQIGYFALLFGES